MNLLPIRSPSVLTPDQRLLLAQASNAFDLAADCRSLACRRAGVCRGFEKGGSARCLLTMIGILGTCSRLARVLLPGVGDADRKPSLRDEMHEQMERMQRHALGLIRRQIDQLEGEPEPAEGRENKLV
ncbi:MAG: hypothetical protein IT539_00875 [Bradyrhizobiaceae bacterium]|nr:hypothetical protein [Bradyrhizobiaceae bacterium]